MIVEFVFEHAVDRQIIDLPRQHPIVGIMSFTFHSMSMSASAVYVAKFMLLLIKSLRTPTLSLCTIVIRNIWLVSSHKTMQLTL